MHTQKKALTTTPSTVVDGKQSSPEIKLTINTWKVEWEKIKAKIIILFQEHHLYSELLNILLNTIEAQLLRLAVKVEDKKLADKERSKAVNKIINIISEIALEANFFRELYDKNPRKFYHDYWINYLIEKCLLKTSSLAKALGVGLLFSDQSFVEVQKVALILAGRLALKDATRYSPCSLEEVEAIIKKYFDKSLGIDDKQVGAYLTKGIAYSTKTEEKEKALACFNKGLSLDPNNIDILAAKMALHRNYKEFEEAIVCCKAILKIVPTDPYILWFTGSIHKNLSIALSYFEIALVNIDRDSDSSLMHQVYRDKSYVEYRLGKQQAALRSVDAALNLNRCDPQVLYYKGLILEELKRYQEARVCYEACCLYGEFHVGKSRDKAVYRLIQLNRFLPPSSTKTRKYKKQPIPAQEKKQSVTESTLKKVESLSVMIEQQQIVLQQALAQKHQEEESRIHELKQLFKAGEEKYNQSLVVASLVTNVVDHVLPPIPSPLPKTLLPQEVPTAVVNITKNAKHEMETPSSDEVVSQPIVRMLEPAITTLVKQGRYHAPAPEKLDKELSELRETIQIVERSLAELRSKMSNQKSAQEKLQQLEAKMQPLIAEYQLRQRELAEQKYILTSNSNAIRAFYIHLQAKLNQTFIALHATASGTIVSSSALGKGINLAGSLLNKFTLGISGAIAAIVTFFKDRGDRKQAQLTVETYAYSIVKVEEMVERVARQLTLRYEEQIRLLSVSKNFPSWFKMRTDESLAQTLASTRNLGGAQILAECVAKRVLCGVANKKFAVDEWIDFVFTARDQQGNMGIGLADVTLDTANAALSKEENWTDSLLYKTGIKVLQPDGSFHYYMALKDSKNDYCVRAQKYGFRLGTAEEVRHLNLQKVTREVLLPVLSGPGIATKSPVTESKGFTQFVREIGAKQEAVDSKTELLGAHVQLQNIQLAKTTEENYQLQQRVALLEQQITQLIQIHQQPSLVTASSATALVNSRAVSSPVFSRELVAPVSNMRQSEPSNLSLAPSSM